MLLADLLWTQNQVQRALGEDVVNVFPPLALLAPLTVRIPIYKVIAIRAKGRSRRHMDVSELVADSISVSRDEAEAFAKRHAGFFEACRSRIAVNRVADV